MSSIRRAKPFPAPSVTLEDTARSLTRSLETSPAGYYEFDGLPPAEYRLSVSAPSFAQMTTQAVRIEVDQRVRLDLHTALAARGEHIVVTARTPATSNDSSDLGAVLDQTLVDGLPLNERDFLQLALLLPGTTTPVQGSQLSTRGGFAMHANGGREENNNFLLDGVDNNDSDVRGYVARALGRQHSGVQDRDQLLQRRIWRGVGRTGEHRHAQRRQRVSRNACTTICATAIWTPATSSTAPTSLNSSGTSSGPHWAAPS